MQPAPQHHESSKLKRGHRKGAPSAKGRVERTCLVTRETKSPEELIRFVLSQDGAVVPDVKAKLPGRGVWLTAERSIVEQAISKRLFAKGFRQAVKADEELADQIDARLATSAFGVLGLARKAGQIVTGFAKVEAALKSGEVAVLITAADAADDGRTKLERIAKSGTKSVNRITLATSDELSVALGHDNVVHAAALAGDHVAPIWHRFHRLERYRELSPSIPTYQSGDRRQTTRIDRATGIPEQTATDRGG